MHHRSIPVLLIAVTVLLAACRRDPPPPPEPVGPSPEEIEQARQDSIEAARQAEEEARRAEAERRAEEERRRLNAERQARGTLAEVRDALTRMVHFEYDQSRITSEAEQLLREKVEILRSNPDVTVRLEGHADERGSTEYNLALGQRRAESAKEFMVGFGIEPSRIRTISYGEERPLVDQSNERAWAQNRRVEVVVLSGGEPDGDSDR